eukprot:SAG22_NODE_393_length_11204_cov_5.356686_3_plen_264_part_00
MVAPAPTCSALRRSLAVPSWPWRPAENQAGRQRGTSDRRRAPRALPCRRPSRSSPGSRLRAGRAHPQDGAPANSSAGRGGTPIGAEGEGFETLPLSKRMSAGGGGNIVGSFGGGAVEIIRDSALTALNTKWSIFMWRAAAATLAMAHARALRYGMFFSGVASRLSSAGLVGPRPHHRVSIANIRYTQWSTQCVPSSSALSPTGPRAAPARLGYDLPPPLRSGWINICHRASFHRICSEYLCVQLYCTYATHFTMISPSLALIA